MVKQMKKKTDYKKKESKQKFLVRSSWSSLLFLSRFTQVTLIKDKPLMIRVAFFRAIRIIFFSYK